jgi:citrate lyase beta subunit
MNLSYFITPALALDALNLHTSLYHTCVILDLKDCIHARVKQRARQELADFDFAQLNGQLQIGVRINPISSIEGVRDIELLYGLFARGGFPISHIVIPEIKSSEELLIYHSILCSMPARPKMIPVIETSEGVDDIEQIAALSDALMCGHLDLITGVFSANQRYLDSARTSLCIAAARHGILAIDCHSFELEDQQSLEAECIIAKSQGFTAKAVIDMVQVPIVNSVFAIPEDEIVRCRVLINKYDEAEGGVVVKQGQLVVSPSIIDKARRIIDFYDSHVRKE